MSHSTEGSGKRFVMSSAVITGPGTYEYRLLAVDDARQWLDDGPFESIIKYAATASAMETLLGVTPPVGTRSIHMSAGDEALVFRLRGPVSGPRIKHAITPDYVLKHVEVGLLKRTA